MKIIVLGEDSQFDECRLKFSGRDCTRFQDRFEAARACTAEDVIFDFTLHDEPGSITAYAPRRVTVFVDTCFGPLGTIVQASDVPLQCLCFGFNGLPSLFNREHLEVTLWRTDDHAALTAVCAKLSTSFRVVRDQAGLVTPRIICMIINEAFYAKEDGTAVPDDIDLAMKLGTNYPYGPFEWCARIGADRVCRLLDAVYQETADPRYEVAPLLRSHDET